MPTPPFAEVTAMMFFTPFNGVATVVNADGFTLTSPALTRYVQFESGSTVPVQPRADWQQKAVITK